MLTRLKMLKGAPVDVDPKFGKRRGAKCSNQGMDDPLEIGDTKLGLLQLENKMEKMTTLFVEWLHASRKEKQVDKGASIDLGEGLDSKEKKRE
jgi:hypothetical protein